MNLNFNFHGAVPPPPPPPPPGGFSFSFLPGGGFSIQIPAGIAYTMTMVPAGNEVVGEDGNENEAAGEDGNENEAAGEDGNENEAAGEQGNENEAAGEQENENEAAGEQGNEIEAAGEQGNAVAAAPVDLRAQIPAYSELRILSQSQVMYLLNDNTINALNQFQVPPPLRGVFMYNSNLLRCIDGHPYDKQHSYFTQDIRRQNQQWTIKYRRSLAAHQNVDHPHELVVSRRYFREGQPKFLIHYRLEDELTAPWSCC